MTDTAKTLDEAREQIDALRATNRRLHTNAALNLRAERKRLREIVGSLASHLEDECSVSLDDVLGDPALAIAQDEAQKHREEYGRHETADPDYERSRLHALSEDAHEAHLDAMRGEQ